MWKEFYESLKEEADPQVSGDVKGYQSAPACLCNGKTCRLVLLRPEETSERSSFNDGFLFFS